MYQFIVGFLCLITIIFVGIPLTVMSIFWIQSIPQNVSLDPQYSEIYNQTFEVQNPLFICQWSDTKDFYLDSSSGDIDIGEIEKGTRLRVKKVTKSQGFASTRVKILVNIDHPQFSTYKAISADDLILRYCNLGYSDNLALFDPNYLKNIEVNTLQRAVQYEDLEAIKHLTLNEINQQNMDGKAPLHYARSLEIASYLLNNGANPNITDKWGKTLLHYAAKNNLYDIVHLLVTNGALIDQRDNNKDTPLLIAADAKHFDIVVYLLRSGADPLLKGQYQQTVLLNAAHHDRLDVVKIALQLGADPLAISELSTMSGVLFAARNNNLEMAKLFIEAGAPVNCANNSGETPLHYVSRNLPMLQYFIENGADIQRVNKHEKTVLHLACSGNDLKLIQYLCEKGGNINQGDSSGRSPFIEAVSAAVSYENMEIIKWLTKNGADLCQANKKGETPLHLALYLAHDSKILDRIIRWLLEHGARADQPDKNGVTPLNIAEKYENQCKGMKDIIELLKMHKN
ncbi:MAG: ankyrin repeat domain-containing protein [Candidatus Protochlamydia sp.]|nr:ankyrin repeat domain-containing protein [Candidatus Protochlamydia sp.]